MKELNGVTALGGCVVGPIRTCEAWDAAVAGCRGATPYQRCGWLDSWAAGTDGTPVFVSDRAGRYCIGAVLTTAGGDGELYVPRGPVGRDARAILDAVETACRLFPRVAVCVGPYLAWGAGGSDVFDALRRMGFSPTGARWHGLTAIVALDGEDRIVRRASRSFQHGLIKARRAGIRADLDNSPAAAERFFDLYAAFMAGKVAHLDPRPFFLELISRFEPQRLGTLLFARTPDGALVSAALALRSGPLAWLSRAPRPPGVSQPFGAFVQFEVMRWAMRQGCTVYDLGGVEDDGEGLPRPTGLTRFKRSLGASFVRLIPELRRSPA